MQNKGGSDSQFMTRKRLQVELQRCEYCEEKPCQNACPANCSPFDFIMAARVGNPSDLQRSAGEIMRANPLGGVRAGLGAASALAQMGYSVDIFESRDRLGGALNLIPDHRLDKRAVQTD